MNSIGRCVRRLLAARHFLLRHGVKGETEIQFTQTVNVGNENSNQQIDGVPEWLQKKRAELQVGEKYLLWQTLHNLAP